ncbi:MAG TPA: tRNA (N6-isopentenyl adenosine(37)-C2)-methylthiotransferase MiaB [Bacteroidetes bacterium]|nr:tRNA (N6-isopentenyl adenosine(37)-C2)-methylthiotransferase MiaB [Bacteroidota bacterium]
MLVEKTIDEAKQGEAYAGKSVAEPAAGKRAYIETYGCQMNFSDTEIIASVLTDMGYGFTKLELEADLVLLNTCSIRENAETKIWNRLQNLKGAKRKNPGMLIGVMGCMAERLKKQFLEKEQLVDLVVGPDAYRDIPKLVEEAESGQKSVNVLLSREETYADIAPIRLNSNGVTGFISIMRGCDNMCSFCVVPFTRGRERSRDAVSIVGEARQLVEQGYKEVTLLGQNVDSFSHEGVSFANLLEMVAKVSPELRVRFSTSHPKDITDDVLHTMAAYKNICNYIHLPAQSGNTRVLDKMKRGYSREWYMDKVNRIRKIIPECAISTDIITGFCSESEEEHQDTLSLMEWTRYTHAFMFFYSERPGTYAQRKFTDDVPLEVKKRRLREVIEVQNRVSLEWSSSRIGETFEVLIEGNSKRSVDDFCGRNDFNQMVVFPKNGSGHKPGDYVRVKIIEATQATLKGHLI